MIRPALAACCALLLASCGPSPSDPRRQIGSDPHLPAPHQYLLPPMHVVKNIGWGDGAPKAANGLKVMAFAKDLKNPRSLYVLPNGDVLVAETDGPGEPITRPKQIIMNLVEKRAHSHVKAPQDIILLRDTNSDGKPDVRTVFLDHLKSPFGMVLVDNDFYVANTDGIMRFPYQQWQTRITAPGTLLTPLPGGPIDHHWTKSLTANPDGTKLYAGVGSNSNIAENGMEAEKERAAIWEVDRATGAHRLYATGTRNPNGLTFQPETGLLWAVVNERDELGPDLVPDYMTSIKAGGFYGWPYSYYGQHLDPRVKPQRPDQVARAIRPDYALSSHVAPLGLVFNTGQGLPARYQGGAFIGEHGSWNRSDLNGYRVVFVPFRGGWPNGKTEDVLTGFVRDGKAHGRPVGLAIDRQGALLVADDVGGVVWRVTGG